MTLALVLTADLLFGSRVQGQLQTAGEQVELISERAVLRARLGDAADAIAVVVVVVDLTDEALGGLELPRELESDRELAAHGAPAAPPLLGFYSHVDAELRERAERAGFDLVVPRSRFAREGAALVAQLADSAASAGRPER